jgi:hypothetical protein
VGAVDHYVTKDGELFSRQNRNRTHGPPSLPGLACDMELFERWLLAEGVAKVSRGFI